MIRFSVPTERLLLIAILGILLFNFLTRRCSPVIEDDKPKITTRIDTLWQTKTDTFKVNTVRYKTVYVNPDDLNEHIIDTSQIPVPDHFEEARIYQDTLSNDDIDIYSHNLVAGTLLDSQLSYALKIPREITITKTIEHPPIFRSGLYLFGEIGGNTERLDNISLGVQYNRKGNWFASYRYNLNAVQGNTHNIGVGLRLW